MKKLLTPLLILLGSLVGGALVAHSPTPPVRVAEAQVTYSPRYGTHLVGTVDPTAGAGVAAAEGTLYTRTGATDQLWQKTGSTTTAWTQWGGGAGSFSSLTVTGNITTTTGNVVATTGDVTAGDDLIATDDIAVVDIVATGRTTSAGFTSSIAGDATTPAYNWTNGAMTGGAGSGDFMFGANELRTSLAGTSQLAYQSSQTVALNHLQTNGSIIAVGGNITLSSTRNLVLSGGYIQLAEMAAPGSGGADTVRVYAAVDGGSKTDGLAIFQSGAAQTWAQEP